MAGARSDDRLQQYFDGELPKEDANALRLELQEDEGLRAKLEGLAHLRMLLVAAAEERADEVDSSALFERITARLGESESEGGDGADQGGDAGGPATSGDPPSLPARPALSVMMGGKAESARPRSPSRRSNSVVWIGLGTALAVAAAVLIVVLGPFDLGEGNSGDPLAAGPPPGSEVVEIDFGYSTGAIFSVEGQEGEHYAVVWISDEKPTLPNEAPLPPGVDTAEERIQ